MKRSKTPHAMDAVEGLVECGEDCIMRHNGNCENCGLSWKDHVGHRCRNGGRGTWLVFSSPQEVEVTIDKNKDRLPFGNKRLLCQGNCILSPDSRVFILICIIIIVPVSFFVYNHSNLWIRLGAIFLTLGSILSGATAVLLDPGIEPAQNKPCPEAPQVPLRCGTELLKAGDEIVEFEGVQLVRKWCQTCGMLRPLRAAHCSDCDVCVNEFDHHCVIIGSCVGERTFRFFAMFLWFVTILAWYICIISVYTTTDILNKRKSGKRDKTFSKLLFGHIILIVFTSLIGICVIGFASYYCYLSGKGQTERENFKDDGEPNPFSKGSCVSNWCHRIAGDIPPSKIVASSEFTRLE
eukprot:TRINITY_DN25461_c0_g1_i1.p1 TRINITY_DN25461_c0_g1~~TRINITY_DN25461_c0_g1_i1.p1  ORF type:complete len:351 (+),score=41.28 TRINITY_DN25461_c0_g1_i1:48-1100(+)